MRSLALTLAVALTLSLAACDATSPTEASTVVSIDARDAEGADILYTFEPLATGETFTATFDTATDPVVIRATRTAEGYVDTFYPPAGTAAVRVTYEFDGVEVAQPFVHDGPTPFESGVTDDETVSWHWERDNDGAWRWAKDKKSSLTFDGTQIDTGEAIGMLYTTPHGETVRVTHVWYELIDGPELTPEAIRFETPRGFKLASVDLR